MKLPWYMKEVRTDKEMTIKFHWLWVLWQTLKYKCRSKRDAIYSGNAKVGTILRVYPKHRSHVIMPYEVRIIESTNEYFKTELLFPEKFKDPHIATFEYNSASWVDYHCDRFRIISSGSEV